VRSVGEDVSAAELLLPEGHRLRGVDLAAAAAAGATQRSVRRAPVVAVLPTGDEVRPIGSPTGPGEILDTNSLMLATQAREAGCEARCLPIEADHPARLARGCRGAGGGAAGRCGGGWRAATGWSPWRPRARAVTTTRPRSWLSSAPSPCTV